jgi:hypothetical protein
MAVYPEVPLIAPDTGVVGAGTAEVAALEAIVLGHRGSLRKKKRAAASLRPSGPFV